MIIYFYDVDFVYFISDLITAYIPDPEINCFYCIMFTGLKKRTDVKILINKNMDHCF